MNLENYVKAVAVFLDRRRTVTSSDNMTICLWDVMTWESCLHWERCPEGEIQLAFVRLFTERNSTVQTTRTARSSLYG
ncbi:hypothetical protein BDR03DRAFT_962594 [Suillus americanus]|nr:hypothetical protein BDR03DRAFT_962594 [Suillus americanus]